MCIVRISASETGMREIGSGAGGCGRSSETTACREKMPKVPKWMKELFGGGMYRYVSHCIKKEVGCPTLKG